MDKKKIAAEVKECLDLYNIKNSEIGIGKVVDSWARKKKYLIETLRKHPNWNEDQLSVSTDCKIIRNFGATNYCDLFISLMNLWVEKVNKEKGGALIKSKHEILSSSKTDLNNSMFNSYSTSGWYDRYFELCEKKIKIAAIYHDCVCFENENQTGYMNLTLRYTEYENIHDIVTILEKNYVNGTLNEEHYKRLNELGIKCCKTQKFSRILNKFFELIGITSHPEYNQLFAKIADEVNPENITRRTFLSVHPCDFFMMSNGNGWKSCHNINDGSYKAGTMSYMLDSSSFVLYTISSEYTGEKVWQTNKINRQMFMYDNGTLLQSRLYPNSYGDNAFQKFREAVQNVFAKCEDVENSWKETASIISRKTKTTSNSSHYKDYNNGYGSNITVLNEKTQNIIKIGARSKCVHCGTKPTPARNLLCCDCSGW
jgi:hypothetical protein